VHELVSLAGGASQEAWGFTFADRRLVLRRDMGGSLHDYGTDRYDEYRVIETAHRAGVLVPEPLAYTDDLLCRAASLAPVILVILRFCQGLAIGGLWGGAVLVATENAPPNRRGFYGCFAKLGVPVGVILANVRCQVAAACRHASSGGSSIAC
jgi:hypothetical protein